MASSPVRRPGSSWGFGVSLRDVGHGAAGVQAANPAALLHAPRSPLFIHYSTVCVCVCDQMRPKPSVPQLFAGDEEEGDEEEDGSRFDIKPQFEGRVGQKVRTERTPPHAEMFVLF